MKTALTLTHVRALAPLSYCNNDQLKKKMEQSMWSFEKTSLIYFETKAELFFKS